MLKRPLYLALPLMLIVSVITAQSPTAESAIDSTDTEGGGDAGALTFDSSALEEDTGKHYLTALSGAIAANGAIFLWNKFMIGAEWTKVSYSDIDHFWQKSTSWDNDWYWTNFVLHPYQGSLAYMAARNSNLNRIESLVLATGSSFAWEYLCETNEPSRNDLIYTPIGSFPVGEMLYRLSLEADNISRLLGYAINPMRLYTDPIIGHKPRGATGNISALSLRLSFGVMPTWSRYTLEGERHYKRVNFPAFAIPEIYVVYGNPYGHQTHDPFSEFELRAGGGIGYNETEKEAMYDIHIFSNGLLWTWAPVMGKECDTTIGLGYDYDFIWHSFMELSSIAPGFVIKQRTIGERATYEWQFHLGYNILGTSDYFYYFYDYTTKRGLNRNYSFNTGAEAVAQWRRTSNRGHIIDTSLRYYGLYDFYSQKQTIERTKIEKLRMDERQYSLYQGHRREAETGWEDVGILEVSYEIPASKTVSVGLAQELYAKHAAYHNSDRVWQLAYKGQAYVRLIAK